MSGKGVIYILTNPSFKEYVKIGYACLAGQLSLEEFVIWLDSDKQS